MMNLPLSLNSSSLFRISSKVAIPAGTVSISRKIPSIFGSSAAFSRFLRMVFKPTGFLLSIVLKSNPSKGLSDPRSLIGAFQLIYKTLFDSTLTSLFSAKDTMPAIIPIKIRPITNKVSNVPRKEANINLKNCFMMYFFDS